ncbi:murein L,D-transpeptidase catalytic domain family protein [Novosphingobium sp. 9]|uniref:murein L,D-transpeptidase catalytic domain family protein n=1 Tax=Novosphingobium sp. 9 TaxID=2025349 RepID=UPI0021B646A5|nr:murein L,D-transpeptidase catalytic domain family protein [Novosphingobium sp. 9]
MILTRRNFIVAATVMAASSSSAVQALSTRRRPVPTPAVKAQAMEHADAIRASGIRPMLMSAALGALDRHGDTFKRDRIGVVDFASSSSDPRFHLVDLEAGTTTSLLVSHGSGSDPAHSGWLQRFSNQPGSNASSEGAYLTGAYYSGQHGHSQRLIGLDPTNSNALSRAIVVHGAWYAEPDMIDTHGKLGRSEGCLAVGDSQIAQAFAHLGEGRLIYAAKMDRA